MIEDLVDGGELSFPDTYVTVDDRHGIRLAEPDDDEENEEDEDTNSDGAGRGIDEQAEPTSLLPVVVISDGAIVDDEQAEQADEDRATASRIAAMRAAEYDEVTFGGYLR